MPDNRILGGGVSMRISDYGDPPRAELTISRNLKSGKIDVVPLSIGDLIDLIESSAKALRVLEHDGGR